MGKGLRTQLNQQSGKGRLPASPGIASHDFPKSRVLEGAMPPENVWEKVSVLNSTSNLEKAAYLPPPASHRTIFQRAQF